MARPFIILERVGDGYFLTETDRGEYLTDGIGTDDASITVNEAAIATLTSPIEIYNADPTFILPFSKLRIDDGVGIHAQGLMNVDSTYFVLPTTFAPKTLTNGSATSLSLTDDEMSEEIALPFDFTFYGMTYSSVFVCSNGFITFLANQSDEYTAETIPQTDNILTDQNSPDPIPLAAIFGYWVDLLPISEEGRTGGGTIRYQTFGDPGSRIFVVEWKNIPIYDAPSRKVTTQIWLNETANTVEIHTTKASTDGLDGVEDEEDTPRYATQGIQNHFGTSACHMGGRVRSFFSLERDAVVFSPVSENDPAFGLRLNGDPVLSRYQSFTKHLTVDDIESMNSSVFVTLVSGMHHTIISPVLMSVESTSGSPYTVDSGLDLAFMWGSNIETTRAIQSDAGEAIALMLQTNAEASYLSPFSVANDTLGNPLGSYRVTPLIDMVHQDLNFIADTTILGGDIELYITLVCEVIRVHDLTVGEA